MKTTGALTMAMFYDSLYQMVNLWAGELGDHLSYAKFLQILFDLIAVWETKIPAPAHPDGYWAFAPLDDVGDVDNEFGKMQEEAKQNAEQAQKLKSEQERQAAETTEQLRLANEEKRRQREREIAAAQQKKARAAAAALTETDPVGAMAALNEEAALINQQIMSGGCTDEELALLRGRLEEVANQLSGELDPTGLTSETEQEEEEQAELLQNVPAATANSNDAGTGRELGDTSATADSMPTVRFRHTTVPTYHHTC